MRKVKPSGIITLLTDFGTEDAYVAAMKGAILQGAPGAVLVDISHAVDRFAILQGAYLLDSAWRSFPPGTIHVAVVDPGVGTKRRGLALEASGHYFIGPDNGIFSYVAEQVSRTVALPTPAIAAPTFHGRDVFAPAAARLASGTGLRNLGSRAAPPRPLDESWAERVGEAWRGRVLHCDHFGNVITNLAARGLSRLHAVDGVRVRVVRTYAEAAPGELVALAGSSGRIEIAMREASAASRLQARPGAAILVT